MIRLSALRSKMWKVLDGLMAFRHLKYEGILRLGSKLKRTLTREARERRLRALRFSPRMDQLEARLVPATHTWIGGGGNANWSTAANWQDNSPPLANEDGAVIIFDTTTYGLTAFSSTNNVAGLTNVTLAIYDDSPSGDFSISLSQAISLASGSSLTSTVTHGTGATISGGTISLSGNATASSTSGTLTISSSMATAGNALTVSGSGNTTLSGTISGTGSLSKSGAGTLTVSGANTFSGDASLAEGTVIVARSTTGTVTNGPLGTGSVTISGGTLRADGSSRTLSNPISVTGDATLGGGAGTLTLTGTVGTTGHRSLTFNTTTTTLSGALLLGGDLTIGGSGGVALSGGVGLGGGDRTLTINTTGGTATIAGAIGSSSSGNTLFFAGSKDLTFNAINAGTTATGTEPITIDFNDAGRTYKFNSSSGSFQGTTRLRGGALVVGNTSPFGAASATLHISGGQIRTSGSSSRTVAQSLILDGSTIFGSSDTGALTFTGLTTIASDSAVAASKSTVFGGGLAWSANRQWTFDSGSTSVTVRGPLSGGSNTLTLSGTGTNVLFGDSTALTGTSGGIVVDGPTVNFAGTGSSFTGGVTAKSGTVHLGASSRPTSVWTASTARALGVIVVPTSANGLFYEVTTAGTSGTDEPDFAGATTPGATLSDGTIVYTVRATPTGPIGVGTLTIDGGGIRINSNTTVTLANPFVATANGGGFTKATGSSSSTLAFSGGGDFNGGALTIANNSGGTLTVQTTVKSVALNADMTVEGSGGVSEAFHILGGATFSANRRLTINDGIDSSIVRGTVTGGASTFTLAGTSSGLTFGDSSGAVSGTLGGLVVDGPTVNFAAAGSSFTGGVTVRAGTAVLSASSSSPNGPVGTDPLTLDGGAIRVGNNTTITLANPLTVTSNGGTFAKGVGGSSSTLNLTGGTTLSGGTITVVNNGGGTLTVQNTSLPVTLNADTTIDGTSGFSEAFHALAGLTWTGDRTLAVLDGINSAIVRGNLSGGSSKLTFAGTSAGITLGDSTAPARGGEGGVVVNGPTVSFASSLNNFTGLTLTSGVIVAGANSASTTTWAATTARALGVNVVPTTPNGLYYEVTTAGTSGSSQPDFAAATTPGSTLSDGTIVYTVRATPTGPFGTGGVALLNGILRADASRTLNSSIALGPSIGSGTGTIDVSSSGATLTLSGVLSNNGGGTGNLTKTGPGGLTLTGSSANTFTGLTTVTNGALTLNKLATTNDAILGDLSVTGGVVHWASSNQIPDYAAISASGSGWINFNNYDENFASLTLSDSASLGTPASPGSGNAGTHVISGTTSVSGSSLFKVGSGGSWTTANLQITSTIAAEVDGNSASTQTSLTVGSGGVSLTGGTLVLNRGTTTNAKGSRLALGGDLTVNASSAASSISTGSGTIGSAVVDLTGSTRTMTVADGSGSVDAEIAATLQNGGLAKAGSGTLLLSAASTYTGTTTVSAGQLRVSHNQSLGRTTGATIVNAGAQLGLAGSIELLEPITLNGDGPGGTGALINVSGTNRLSGLLTVNTDSSFTTPSGTLIFGGALAGSGRLTDGGNGGGDGSFQKAIQPFGTYVVRIEGIYKGEASLTTTSDLAADPTPIVANSWQEAVLKAVYGSSYIGSSTTPEVFPGGSGSIYPTSLSGTRYDIGTAQELFDRYANNNLLDITDITPDTKLIAFEDLADNDYDDDYWIVTVTEPEPYFAWAGEALAWDSEWTPSGYDWSARQALGPSNTLGYDDLTTSWAADPMNGPTDADGNVIPGIVEKTLTLKFDFGVDGDREIVPSMDATGIVIRQSDGNYAADLDSYRNFVTKIEVRSGGSFTTVWEIGDPVDPLEGSSSIPTDFKFDFEETHEDVDAVRITVDINHDLTTWEEIDSVRLLTTDYVIYPKKPLSAESFGVTLDEDDEASSTTISALNLWNQVDYPTEYVGQLLRIDITTQPEHGYFSIDTNGTPSVFGDDVFTYTPDPDYFGTDTVTYTVKDIWGQSASGTITFTIDSLNDPPFAVDVYAVGEKNAPKTTNVVADAFDVEEDTLSVSAASVSSSLGSVTFSGGSITFTPANGVSGIIQIPFTISDGSIGGTSSAMLYVNIYEVGEWAASVVASTQYNTDDYSASQAAGEPDTFFYGDIATAWAALKADDGPQTVTATFSGSNYATGVVVRETNASGFVTQLVLHYIDSTYDVIPITDPIPSNHAGDLIVTFPQTTKKVASVTVTVDTDHVADDWEEIDAIKLLTGGLPTTTSTTYLISNTAPTAFDLHNLADPVLDLVLDPIAAAYDADGDVLTIVLIDGQTPDAMTHSVTLVSGAVVTIVDNKLVYTPSSVSGDDSFTFTLGDGHGGVDTKTAYLNVNTGVYASSVIAVTSQTAGSGGGSAPQALGSPNTSPGGWAPSRMSANQSLTVGFGAPATASAILIHEGGTEGFVVKVEAILVGDSSVTLFSGIDDTDPAIDPNFVIDVPSLPADIIAVRITVDPSKNGRIDAVKLLTSSAIIPTAPTGSDLSASTTENVPVKITPSASGSGLLQWSVSGASHGSVFIDAGTTPNDPSDDTFLYVPYAGYNGPDSFTYTATDSFGQFVTKTVTITIADVNQAPVAGDAFAYAARTGATTIDVLANSFDADDDTLTITLIDGQTPDSITNSVTLASGAVVTIVSGNLEYVPGSAPGVTDAFTVTISDGSRTGIGRVFVQIADDAVWAENVIAYSSQVSTSDGAAAKITGAPDAAVDSANAWQPTGETETDSITVDFGASAVSATGLLIRGSGGAISKIEYNAGSGAFTELWTGSNPTSFELQDFMLTFASTLSIGQLKITLTNASGSTIDAVGLLAGGTTGASVVASSRAFDGSGRFVVTQYDSAGRETKVSTYFRDRLNRVVESTYNVDGQLTQQDTSLVTSFTGATPNLQTTRLVFDASSGRTLSQTLGYGSTAAATTTYTYDRYGWMISLVDPVSNETTWTFDDDARTRLETNELNAQTLYHYDSAGRIDEIIDANNRRRTFAFNSNGVETSEKWYTWDAGTSSWDLVKDKEFAFNADGLLTSAGDDTGTYTYTYDYADRIVAVSEPVQVLVGGILVPFEVHMGYDPNGYRNLIEDNLGNREESLYSSTGELLRRTTTSGSTVLRIDQEFDAYSRVIEQRRYSDAAGTTLVAKTVKTYDPWTGQITSIVHTNPADDVLSSFEYTYDLAGQMTSKTEFQPEFDLDPVTTLYTYDAQGQLTADGDIDFDYDPNGNREDVDGTPYTTGPDNQLLSDGLWTYTYDPAGNRATKESISTAEIWTYGYDHQNQLIEVERATNGVDIDLRVGYSYDVWGNRITKSVDQDGDGSTYIPETMKFAIDGWNPIKPVPIGNENYDVWADIAANGSLTTHYTRGDQVDELVARTYTTSLTAEVYWYATDHLGSIRNVIDLTGNSSDAISYDAFGNVINEVDASCRGRYAWTGRETESEIQLQYNRSRYYDPSAGKWVTEDSVGFNAGDSNLYRYVANAPTNYFDPSGMGAALRLPPPPPGGLSIFRGPNPATPVPANPTGWTVLGHLGKVIQLNALQMQAINEWAVADDNFHKAELARLDPATLPKDNLIRTALENPTVQSVQAVENAIGRALKSTCVTKIGTQAFVWQNINTQAYHTGAFDPSVDRLIFAFAHLDNTKIGTRNTDTGSPTTRRSTRWVRLVGGDPNDDAGHAIGFQLGGSGRKEDGNIFPQNWMQNQRIQRNFENEIAAFARGNQDGCVTILVALKYRDQDNAPPARRPTVVIYGAALTTNAGNTTPLLQIMLNPPSPPRN